MSHCEEGVTNLSVSAVIPVKNRPALIAAAIRSCLGQTVVPDEIIVVDDGSDDATPDTVMEMARMESRIRLIRRGASGGAALARNDGAALASMTAGMRKRSHSSCIWPHSIPIRRRSSAASAMPMRSASPVSDSRQRSSGLAIWQSPMCWLRHRPPLSGRTGLMLCAALMSACPHARTGTCGSSLPSSDPCRSCRRRLSNIRMRRPTSCRATLRS
ncbi:MAG: glycosyltransferase [Alphaproteobacteria bacterium]|nr:MAG: glycosyltransferase [Alphaproteobacteria bacterium]